MFRRIYEKARMWRWQRDQMTNLELREHFRSKHRIDVGLYSYGCFDEWRMTGPIKVGRYCSIAKTVRSVPINHPYDALTTHPALYESQFGVVDESITWDDVLVIEDDVWIGHYAVILPGCKYIGRGAIVGAGAIVTKNVEPYTIVAGNPAKVIRHRFDDAMKEAVERTRWWQMSFEELRKARETLPDAIHHPDPENLEALRSVIAAHAKQ